MPTLARTPREAAASGLWLLPAGILGLIAVSGLLRGELLLAALFALVVVAFAARRPDLALLALIALLPFQGFVLAKLYAWGVPSEVVRPLGGWKEALALGVVVAGLQGYRASRKPLDALDWLAIGFIGLAAVYALLPGLFAPDAPQDSDVRSLALRQSAGFVILFLAARHARLPGAFLERAMRTAFAVGSAIAAIAIYEYFFSDAWNEFVVETIQYGHYQVQVLNVFPPNALDYRVYGHIAGEEIIRVGSVFLGPLSLGFYLLVGFAVGIERVVRGGARPAVVAALFVVGAALLLSQTRSALIGALIIAALAFRFAPGRRGGRRIQFAFVLVIGLLVALPAASSTGLADRASTTASSDDPNATDHLEALRDGVESLVEHPLGQGLGTSAGIGQRFQQAAIISENNYLQVGNEIGIPAMATFVFLTVLAILRLRRAALKDPDVGIAAIWTAATGLAVGAFFLHTWNDFAVSWTLWGLAGAALGIGARRSPQGTGGSLPGTLGARPAPGDRHPDPALVGSSTE